MRYNIFHCPNPTGGDVEVIGILPIRIVREETGAGKKSPRRQVPYEQYEANWELAFGKKKDQALKDWTPDLKNQMN